MRSDGLGDEGLARRMLPSPRFLDSSRNLLEAAFPVLLELLRSNAPAQAWPSPGTPLALFVWRDRISKVQLTTAVQGLDMGLMLTWQSIE
jgi:hypothetical protein